MSLTSLSLSLSLANQSGFTSKNIVMAVACVLVGLVVVGVGGFLYYKYRDYKKKISSLQNALHAMTADLDDAQQTTMIKNLKAELEAERARLAGQLREVETKREENKSMLQAVKQKIREATFDRREDLLREKEQLLNAQWKLDETKKNNEGQMLFIEKQLEPIDIRLSRVNSGKKDV
ncbi:ribonuclease Y-like [Centropristis striata]|uniref:ribonuclease Y-like n=1 Tax=Centropristis striata TaxID=184440 RepID=UPI0027E20EF6|nr:ribonuclease Y-like [Centropristis striata]